MKVFNLRRTGEFRLEVQTAAGYVDLARVAGDSSLTTIRGLARLDPTSFSELAARCEAADAHPIGDATLGRAGL